MSQSDEEQVGEKDCLCGCGKKVILRKRHFYPSHLLPDFIKGHQQFNNKRGWKGGKIVDMYGYVLVYSPNHPNRNAMGRGYVKRSRLVMEKKLKRYLQNDEIVHHKNGIKNDDRIKNLTIMTNSEHLSLHHKNENRSRDKLGKFIKEKKYGS